MKITVLMLHNHFADFRHLMLHNEFASVEGNHHDISILVSFTYWLEIDNLWELFLHLLNKLLDVWVQQAGLRRSAALAFLMSEEFFIYLLIKLPRFFQDILDWRLWVGGWK